MCLLHGSCYQVPDFSIVFWIASQLNLGAEVTDQEEGHDFCRTPFNGEENRKRCAGQVWTEEWERIKLELSASA